MNVMQIQRDVVRDVTNDISVTDNTSAGWSQDFTLQGVQNGLSFSRASNAGYYNSAGVWSTAAPDAPRIDYDPTTLQARGLLIEEPRTNYLLNSAAPATQTVALAAGTYTLWVKGTGNCICAAGTAVGSGFATATETTARTFTITTAGTVVFTVSGSLSRFQCENGSVGTSFIATTTSAATRSGDVCWGTPLGNINPAEGTFAVTCTAGTGAAYSADDGSGGGATRAHMICASTSRTLYLSIGGVQKSTYQDFSLVTLGAVMKMAFSYSATSNILAVNGVIKSNIATPSNAFAVTTLRVGCRFLPTATGFLNGYVRKVSYQRTALTADQLQQLTV